MADKEFEEFKQYFDQLPQYIKAPAHCYTLVHDIDLDDDSPAKEVVKLPLNPNNPFNQIIRESLSCITVANSSEDPIKYDGNDSINEPFSGDLQLIPDRDGRESPLVTRRRRKLPELPKTAPKRWNEDSRLVSLAQELSDADRYSNQYNGNGQFYYGTCQGSSVSNRRSSPDPVHRPTFVLKFHQGGRDDDSSPDSEKYPSLDSGHSTIHSEDGSKPYSPQVTSINESLSPTSPSIPGIPFSHLEILEATHRGLHKFIPRHHDEIEVEIGDPIYMQKEADDLWCEGVNLRTGMQGIFPSAYVVDVDYNDFDPAANKVKKERYLINYVGSIETHYHKGNDVLCQAVKKISSHEGYVASHTRPCILEISDQGIRMVDKGKPMPNQEPCHDYFYALKNVSFCGFHPYDHRYFGFVTKHPTLNRFACHVFISEDSTRPIAESVGRAFQRFYQKFIETAYPIEDIYIE